MTAEQPVVLCIAGSPRRHGNSERLLDALMQGVEEAGGKAVRLVAKDAGVSPCLGCNACSKSGRCIQRDGMDEVYALVDAADAVAVATPVFFATVPGVLKVLLDRFQPYWARRYVLGEPRPERKRPGAVLIVGGGGDPFGTTCALNPIRSVFAVLSVAVDHVVECVGPDKPGDIVQAPEALIEARQAGSALVREVRERR
jgi:multimeric flavodoxin WrbA